ncbi:hypothetical protein GCM10017783_12920 [Deinococcus piscis]|uniref:Peripheral subunit-binding (PSBD) domain-containing protein n=1 Tax=Deinococcus piscis TaxID=394230 RepID=A0ABQ3K3B1_9DEIO|nr:E3 binding domain-containing protein [Deinococcus piscis]GHG02098.1 hypothetical protein GCM10017783_12920 [Deinococcus piscis]
MDNISPLAKTLAESNGIDWRAIQGSGAGGQIVEQDIINYLTRVMSGEEEPPATPVDLPPPDWTGDELPAGMSAEMLSQAGVESDIAALVNQAPAGQSMAGQEWTGQAPLAQGEQLEEDEFELDMEDEPAAPAPVMDEVVPASTPVEPMPVEPTPPVAGGLGGLLSQLYQAPAAQTSGLAAEPAGTELADHGMADGYMAEPSVAQAADAQETVYTETVQSVTADAPAFTDGRESAADLALEEVVPEEVVPEEVVHEELAPEQPEELVQQAVEPEAANVAAVEQEMPAVAAAVAPTAPERPEQAVWFGVYLRRDADVQAASALRDQLNAALGQDVPLSLLVARAAQQHAEMLGLGAVAIQDVHSQRARSVGGAGAGLRDALSALDRDHDGQADLLVVNAGTFELDELHYPDTVTLSLGRVVDGRAALSLNGDVDTVRAAEFLAAVAASLEAPVALII